MYGNEKLPGIAVSDQFRNESSIWQGATQATWFKNVNVNGSDGDDILIGTILKELPDDGSYSPISESDIISDFANLPGSRLVIVADSTAQTGSNVLVGTMGIVDKSRLYVGDKAFSELSDSQKIFLNSQLEAWNFQLVHVTHA